MKFSGSFPKSNSNQHLGPDSRKKGLRFFVLISDKKTYKVLLTRALIGFLLCLVGVEANAEPDSLAIEKAFFTYLRIASVSGNEFEAGRFLEQTGKSWGLETACLNCTDTSINIALSLFPLSSKKPNILLFSHLDVVPADDSLDWKFSPFSPPQTDTAFLGRGALDAKGLTFMHLVGLLKWKKSLAGRSLPFNVTVLSVCGEETGGFRGAKVLSEHFMDILQPWAVYGEGGSGVTNIVPSKPELAVFGIAVAEKTNLWLRLDLKFNSFGHGAAPPSSYVNKDMLKALHKLSEVEGRIEFNKTTKRMFRHFGSLEGGFKGFVLKHLHWTICRPAVHQLERMEPLFSSLLKNTSVLTNIYNPPGPPNQISTKATAFLDCRLLPQTNLKKFIRDIKYGLFEPRFKVSIINECPIANESSPDLPEYKALSDAIISNYPNAKTIPILFPASTDNNYFRQFGIPTYGITPALLSRIDLASIHGINELIRKTDFYLGAGIVQDLLKNLELSPGRSIYEPLKTR